jgi:hypothetical protein
VELSCLGILAFVLKKLKWTNFHGQDKVVAIESKFYIVFDRLKLKINFKIFLKII